MEELVSRLQCAAYNISYYYNAALNEKSHRNIRPSLANTWASQVVMITVIQYRRLRKDEQLTIKKYKNINSN